MERYAHDKLNHITNSNTRESLIRGILSRAHGIFLWVALVVKTVREHAENDATEDELATLVSSIPDDLDHLFEHLFLSISKVNSKSFPSIHITAHSKEARYSVVLVRPVIARRV